MSTLSEIINQLYEQSSKTTGPVSLTTTAGNAVAGGDLLTERLWRVLCEMADTLTTDEHPDEDETPPTPEICLRIMNHWDSLTQSIRRIHSHMASLDADIARMQPWGDFDVMKVEALAKRGIQIQFWTTPTDKLSVLLTDPELSDFCLQVISQDARLTYLITVSTEGVLPTMPETVSRIEICPSPISTLIMLQTRDKDTLQQMETLRGDYALAHYGEIYAALHQILPPDREMPVFRHNKPRIRQRLHKLLSALHTQYPNSKL